MFLLFFPTLTLFFSYKYYPVVRVSSLIVSLSVQSKRVSYLPLIRINTLKWKVSHIDLCSTFLSSIPSYLSFLNPFLPSSLRSLFSIPSYLSFFNPFFPSFFQSLSIFLSSISFYFSNRFFCLVCIFLYFILFSVLMFLYYLSLPQLI